MCVERAVGLPLRALWQTNAGTAIGPLF